MMEDCDYVGYIDQVITNIGVARIISWGGHRFSMPLGALSSFLVPYCLNFSDEDNSTLTFLLAHPYVLLSILCIRTYEMRMV